MGKYVIPGSDSVKKSFKVSLTIQLLTKLIQEIIKSSASPVFMQKELSFPHVDVWSTYFLAEMKPLLQTIKHSPKEMFIFLLKNKLNSTFICIFNIFLMLHKKSAEWANF